MGDSAPQPNARSLREVLVGLNRFEQHIAAAQWAIANNKVIDIYLLSDIRPKNVLRTPDGTTFVIDAEVSLCISH